MREHMHVILTSVGAKQQVFPPSSFATLSPSLDGRSAITTLAPFRVSLCTVALPKPEAPPVTRQTVFRREAIWLGNLLLASLPYIGGFIWVLCHLAGCLTNRMRMALTILLFAIPSRIFTSSCEKRPGNGTILANGKGISRIPFRTEKEDYLWRLSTISEKIFRKIAFPFDLKTKFPDFLARW